MIEEAEDGNDGAGEGSAGPGPPVYGGVQAGAERTVVVALLPIAAEREQLARAVPRGADVQVYESTVQFIAMLKHQRPRRVILGDPGEADGGEAYGAVRRFLAENPMASVLILARLSPLVAREILWMTEVGQDIRVCLQSELAFADAAASLILGEPFAGPEGPMLRRAAEIQDPRVRNIAANIVLLGVRKPNVANLQVGCAESLRAMERHLLRLQLPGPRELMGLSTATHAIFRIEQLGWTVAATASSLGYHRPSDLVHAVKRRFGAPPTEVCNSIGFRRALDQFARAIGLNV